MQETVLMYHIDEQTKYAMNAILSQLDVIVKDIKDEDILQKMGYLLGLDEYQRIDEEVNTELKKSFLYFAFFSDEQIDIVLEVFRRANIAYIPYKAMLTRENVDYTFKELYENVEHEYQSITNTIDK